MRVTPINNITFRKHRLPYNTEPETPENKKGLEDINPSFKYYMSTCQPIKPQITFTGHWPQYKYSNPSPLFDPNGMLFPLTVLPTPEGHVPGRLNYLA